MLWIGFDIVVETVIKFKVSYGIMNRVILFVCLCICALPQLLAAVTGTVAISQIIDHPPLNINRQGIMDVLKEHDVSVVFQNAQGQISISNQIAKKFVGDRPDVIVTISTPSTQSVMSANKEQHIPVVFSSITDPQAAYIVNSKGELLHNYITGTTDSPPIDEFVEILSLMNINTVGVVYNPSEINSLTTVRRLKKIEGLNVMTATINSSVNVSTAVESIMNKVDAIIIPLDNTVNVAMDVLIRSTNSAGVPVFSFDSLNLAKGVLMSVGFSQYEVGRHAGQQVVDILQGKSPKSIPIESPQNSVIMLNTEVAKKLHIEIPQSVLSQAIVYERKEGGNGR